MRVRVLETQRDVLLKRRRGRRNRIDSAPSLRSPQRWLHCCDGFAESVTPTSAGAGFMTRTYSYQSPHWSLNKINLTAAATKSTTMAFDSELLMNAVTFAGGDVVTRSHTSSHVTSKRSTTASYNETIWRAVEQDDFGRVHRHQKLDQDGRWGNRFVYDDLGPGPAGLAPVPFERHVLGRHGLG